MAADIAIRKIDAFKATVKFNSPEARRWAARNMEMAAWDRYTVEADLIRELRDHFEDIGFNVDCKW